MFLIFLAFCQPLNLNCESYTKMDHKNISSNFSEMHLFVVYESIFDVFQCLARCNIMVDCQAVIAESKNQILKCSLFNSTPINTDIFEVPNDIGLYFKSGIKLYNNYILNC